MGGRRNGRRESKTKDFIDPKGSWRRYGRMGGRRVRGSMGLAFS
jgi:hypothetical protein